MANEDQVTNPANLIKWYYLATPFFIALDLILGLNLRVGGLLDMNTARYWYYGMCTSIAISFLVKENVAAMLALLETAVNFALCAARLILPLILLTDYLSDDDIVALILNFFLSSVVVLYNLQHNPILPYARRH